MLVSVMVLVNPVTQYFLLQKHYYKNIKHTVGEGVGLGVGLSVGDGVGLGVGAFVGAGVGDGYICTCLYFKLI